MNRRDFFQVAFASKHGRREVMKRDLDWYVVIMLNFVIGLTCCEAKNMGIEVSPATAASFSLPSCIQVIASKFLTFLGFYFDNCYLIFEWEYSFLSTGMESTELLYATTTSLINDLEVYFSNSSKIMLSCRNTIVMLTSQKRKKEVKRSLSNGKVSRRTGTSSNGSSSSALSRRGYAKKRVSTTMYVARDPRKSSTVKDKSTYVLVPRQGDQNLSNKSSNIASSDGNQTFDENGIAGSNDVGKKKVLLLKGKEREIITVSDSDNMSQHHSITSSTKTILSSTALKQNQQHEGSGRIFKSILTNKDFRQSQSSRGHSERQIQTSNPEKEKQTNRPVHVQLILKGTDGAPENRITVHGLHVSGERQDRRFRHKDRPDRGVWTSRSNGGDESLSSSASSQVDPLEGGHTELKRDTQSARNGEVKSLGSLRASHSSENGFNRHFGRRGPIHGVKDVDGYSISSEGKHPRKSSNSAYGSNEKQVWVQKASSGT
ncbi:hypothetical protein P8452_15111 [Trifolium repens]|nr:hypothetical protein P8452_15111 [Trifolium repens]